MLKRKRKKTVEPKDGISVKRSIIVQTDYGHIEIVNLKEVWIGWYLGTCRLMYKDDIYKYNCIYWTDRDATQRYQKLKQKLLDAYNRGDYIVEL